MSDPVYATIRAFETYRREQSPETEGALREALWGTREVIDDELRKWVGLRPIAVEKAVRQAYEDAYPPSRRARS